ncbi:helix-turn-helix domain-containing protein [Actinoalloteichus hymeniacidonis]|uniref:Transcriptional regulator, luxR family n=1 Tax=Actinoalloteichus hymeniacidonis TaxID=340345 RepID=A0AAC9HNI1_9PSEU|nr:helix-turn-helix transcriptional regulator [Actinoalloteichus hymeniacidonis]AOS62016.1 transcriptional regulator, luxR family [Actinoalloteichus hymeniacidonis]MBB5909962.1 DNA-binding NarL/FixJ family response regulator [Actinoalloteichus hymeniacidonis]
MGRREPGALSPRQQELLSLLVAGHSAESCARLMGIALGTVRNYIKDMWIELGLHGLAALIDWGIEHGYGTSGGKPDEPADGPTGQN